MGANLSSGQKVGGDESGQDSLNQFYGAYEEVVGMPHTSVMGGVESKKEYPASFMSAAKKRLIKDLAKVMADHLGVKELKGESDVNTLIELMKKHVPNPHPTKGNKMTWAKDKDAQVQACKVLGQAINERMGDIINLNASPDVLCSQISEVMHTLFIGFSGELSLNHADLERSLKNLRTLKQFLENTFKSIQGKIESDQDSSIAADTSVAREAHQEVINEVDRQLAMLQLALNALEPAQKDLLELLNDSKEYKGLIKKIDKDVGTREFGRKIAYLLSGTTVTAQAAKKIDDALSKVGITFTEYAKAKDFKDLKKLLSEKTIKALNKDEVSLDLYERAKEALYKYQYLHDDIVEQLKKSHKGGIDGGLFNPIQGGLFNPIQGGLFNPIQGGDQEDMDDMDNVEGGLFNPIQGGLFNPIQGGLFNPIQGGDTAIVGGLKLDKRIKRRQDLKKALVRDFNDRLHSYVDVVSRSAKQVATLLSDGKTEMSDRVQKFVKALEMLPSLEKEYTYFCLTGAIDDIRARQEREKFISAVKYVVSTLDDLIKENKSGSLKDMRDAFQHIVDLVDTYVAKFAEGFGPLGTWEQYNKALKGEDGKAGGDGWATWFGLSPDQKAAAKPVVNAIKNATSNVVDVAANAIKTALSNKKGANESIDGVLGGGTSAAIARTSANLQDAITTIIYYHRIAMMRRGLSKAAKEFPAYKEDYVKMLADAVAKGRDDVTTKKNAFLEDFKKDGLFHKWHLWAGYSNKAGAVVAPTAQAVHGTVLQMNTIPPTKTKQDLDSDLSAFIQAKVLTDAESSDLTAQFDKIRELGVNMHNAADNMYKVAEAMDIYMKEFTDGISSNPDDVQNIINILDNTEVISKWFDDRSGDFICEVFDSFPSFYEPNAAGLSLPKFSNLNLDNSKPDTHYYLKVASILNLATPAQLGARGFAGVVAPKIPAEQIRGTTIGLPGNPFLSVPAQLALMGDQTKNSAQSGINAVEKLHKALKQVSSLKNFVASFVNIGEKFGGKELIKKTHIPPKLLLQYLNDYIVYSSVKLGLDSSALAVVVSSSYKINNVPGLSKVGSTVQAGMSRTDLHLGYDSKLAVGGLGDMATYATRMIMRGVDVRPILRNDPFETPDKLFQMVIKSMCAKIMTVIGTFNMFNHPVNKNGLGYFSNLRLVLGGAEQPKVIPEAFELYIRLPLMAEFYRSIFVFDETDGTKISLIPEMDGTFSELISVIFDRAKNVADGNYSETEVRMLIEAINKIFMRFKSSKNPVRDCIEEFVAEVNRRYGVIKLEERKAYLKEIRDRYKTKYDNPEDIVDFELKGIDEDDTFVRPSPSDEYRTVGARSTYGARAHKHELNIESDQKMINDLRTNIDKVFSKCLNRLGAVDQQDPLDALRNTSFQTMINARSHELDHATNDRQRYEIVRSSIASLGTFAVSSLERSYLLFHDTVVTGLNALRLLYKHLSNYENKIRTAWKDYDELRKWTDAGKSNRWNAMFNHPLAYPSVGIAANTQGAPNAFIPANLWQGLNTPYRPQANDDPDRAAQALLRFGIDQEEMFKVVFEALFNHAEAADDLIDVKVEISRQADDDAPAMYKYGERRIALRVDYSKLREQIYALFNHVKGMLDKFRGLLPDTVLNRYEDYNDQTQSSLYWLEKHLIDELIEGRYEDPGRRNDTLEGSNQKLQTLLDYFTRRWDVSALMLANVSGPKQEDINGVLRSFDDKTMHQFTNDIINLIYDPRIAPPRVPVAVPAAGGLRSPAPNVLGSLLELQFNLSGKVKAGNRADNQWSNAELNRLDVYPIKLGEWNPARRDMVFMFNNLVGVYLNQVYDSVSKSVYLPALAKFVAGNFNSSIMGDKNYNDNAFQQTIRFDDSAPNARSILLRSIAVCIRQLVSEKNIAGSDMEYAKSDLAQIPNYVKERLRANLPVLRKLFMLLLRRSELTKKLVVALNVELQTPAGGVPATTNAQVELAFLNTLDQVTNGCQAVIQCIQDVLQDLADQPKYLETYQDFIKDYENINGVSPLMPISSMLSLHNDLPLASWNYGMPIWSLGNDQFKILYATRGLLNNQKHTLADMPGLLDMLKAHNTSVDQRHHISEKDMQVFSNEFVCLLKYELDTRLYRQQLSLIGPNTTDIRDAQWIAPENEWVYQLKDQNRLVPLVEVIRLTESNFQQEERSKIVRHVERGSNRDAIITGSREELIACNLIDLNIVPINLHALMREIPLVNLYNYAYTYDQMINKEIGVDIQNVDLSRKLSFDDVRSADRMFAILLTNPHADIDDAAYEFLVGRIMRGSLGVEGLGRPKYLGDELFNKALFGEIYTNDLDMNNEADAALANSRSDGASGYAVSQEMVHGLDRIAASHGVAAGNYRVLFNTLYRLDLAGKTKAAAVQEITNAGLFAGVFAVAPPAAFFQPANEYLYGVWKNKDNYKSEFSQNHSNASNAVASQSVLHYLEKNSKGKATIKSVPVDGAKEILKAYGKLRFDTYFVRNLFWVSSIQRMLRLKLRRDLTWYNSRVVDSHATLASSITELYDHDMNSTPNMRNPNSYKY